MKSLFAHILYYVILTMKCGLALDLSVIATIPTDRLTLNPYEMTMPKKSINVCLCRSPQVNFSIKHFDVKHLILKHFKSYILSDRR